MVLTKEGFMSKKTIDDLLGNLNEYPSEYEERYFRWVSISYDKNKLLELLYDLKFQKEQEVPDERRINFLENILEENDVEHLHLLLVNDETTARFALIEKWARTGAMEILIKGKYSIDTLNTITQFPLADYQLTVKRIQELVNIIQDITTQSTSMASGVAGI
jgi:hypothetical protein